MEEVHVTQQQLLKNQEKHGEHYVHPQKQVIHSPDGRMEQQQ